MIDQAVAELQPLVGVRAGCAAVGEAQARWYRRHRQSPPPPRPERARAAPPRALSEVERKELHRVLDSEEFVDEGEVRERRRQATHPAAIKPELLATNPNQVYSWDITKLAGPVKWTW